MADGERKLNIRRLTPAEVMKMLPAGVTTVEDLVRVLTEAGVKFEK